MKQTGLMVVCLACAAGLRGGNRAHLPHEEGESIWDEAEVAMRAFEGPNGFEAPCEPIVGVGVK